MPQQAPTFWQEKNIKSISLLPLSFIYRGLGKLDKYLKERKAVRPNIPVISVGNITTGGSGKTPIVALLAEHFRSKGENVAILTRGYGGQIKTSHMVGINDSTEKVGDEPKMLFTMDVANQIWVGPDRRVTSKLAYENGATLIILDDGFQHFKLARDVDILVVGKTGFGNGFTIPAGPLREPIKNHTRADFAVVAEGVDVQLNIPVLHVDRQPNSTDLAPLLGRELFAFCGIGNPLQFFEGIIKADLNLTGRKVFGDHHKYTDEDVKMLVQKSAGRQLITTPKDAEKLPKNFKKRVRVIRPSFDEASAKAIIDLTEKKLNQAKTLKAQNVES
ncbi:MAG: tetraacyldisaccharide 4'-kinase [Alphaproteobacteria bacterium]|jgi:tetraacyldisaccharide 4'-kinase